MSNNRSSGSIVDRTVQVLLTKPNKTPGLVPGFLFGKLVTELKLIGTRMTGPSPTLQGKNNKRRNPKSN